MSDDNTTVTLGVTSAMMLGSALSDAGWSLQLCLNDIRAGRVDDIVEQRMENAIEFIRGVGKDFRTAAQEKLDTGIEVNA
jgi:hypothetical protein